jgi:predicted SnoaL-like aldol condensation-catalyzing enzyme
MKMRREQKNKALLREAFDMLFNKRDYATAERHWLLNRIQHGDHIPAGRDGLFNLMNDTPLTREPSQHST